MEIVPLPGFRLGKQKPRRNPKLPALAAYKRHLVVPKPPVATDFYSKVPSWPMMANDRLGDCTCASVGHCIQQWTTYIGSPRILTDEQVVALYSAVSGYDPANPGSDQGAVEMGVLNYWYKSGVDGDKLSAFCSLNTSELDDIRDSISWFGNSYVGLSLPVSAQTQDTWDVPYSGSQSGPGVAGSWGGHAVPLVGYDDTGFYCVTWGAVKKMTNEFLYAYLDEAYGLINQDFVDATGLTPAGLNLEQLQSDMLELVDDNN